MLPFRPLRADPESDFLGMSLPDAITHSLAGSQSLVVRSSLVGARYADETLDVQKVAAEADVDLVLAGTLLRAGDRLQVSAQLFETPSGTLLKSHIARVEWGDIFDLQGELVRQVVDVLALQLTRRERHNLRRDTPANPAAYQQYLRANEAAGRTESNSRSDRAVRRVPAAGSGVRAGDGAAGELLPLPGQVPGGGRGESVARSRCCSRRSRSTPSWRGPQSLRAARGRPGRREDAMARLLDRLKRAPNSPDIYAGLVYTCRFCGLLDASVAAHLQAQRFSSQVPTSVTQTYFVMGQYERCLQTYHEDLGYIGALALLSIGRHDEARRWSPSGSDGGRRSWARFLHALRALIEGRRDDCVRLTDEAIARHSLGGEELFYFARHYAWAGEPPGGGDARASRRAATSTSRPSSATPGSTRCAAAGVRRASEPGGHAAPGRSGRVPGVGRGAAARGMS